MKKIVELHGGGVNVISTLGKGSHFTIALPYNIPESAIALTATEATINLAEVVEASPPPLDSVETIPDIPLILLAEDNQANIKTFTNYLNTQGYRLVVAENGKEAIAIARADKPDLILMDIQMPGINGLEAIRQIRTNPELAQTPIIALTALAMPGDEERCITAGANSYLAKPVKLKRLGEVIKEFLEI
ncbi:MAG TPA: hybrid sensor histidine kinase/response regulator [Cyanobacteria bacterium UBA9226]|nr:hybrid sensor histidine kinase/response regulator [Cyanobacteria bacterium UBA9226]